MSSEKEKSENMKQEVNGTQSNALLVNQISNSEEIHRVLNDYILMEIFDFIEIKDLFRWLCVSQQFFECIRSVLKTRKHLFVFESELIFQLTDDLRTHLCFEKQHSKTGSDYWKNNIESAITQINSVYYLNFDNNFTSITEKCPLIECLTLKDCYLDETLFKCLESNLKHLKCISIFQCILDIKAIDFINELKTLSQNITHLSIYQIKRLNDESFESNNSFGLITIDYSKRRDMLWNFIKLFKNVKKLNIFIKRVEGFERLLSELIPSLESLDISSFQPPFIIFDNDSEFKTDNISHIKRLNIKDCFIRSEELQKIVNELNLKSFHFSCIRLDINLLSNLAEKHKQLNELSIFWTNFMPYSYVENLFKFENVRHFLIHRSVLNPNQFRQIIGLFPSLAILHFTPYYEIECGLKEEEESIECRNLFRDMF